MIMTPLVINKQVKKNEDWGVLYIETWKSGTNWGIYALLKTKTKTKSPTRNPVDWKVFSCFVTFYY